MASPSPFRMHVENTRALRTAFDAVSRDCRRAIAREDESATAALTNTATFLLGALMENRLYRLLYEPAAFDARQRARILACKSIESMWVAVIREAFAARRNFHPSRIPRALSFTDQKYYEELNRLVRDEIAPVILLRNILGHGQWQYALKSDRSAIDQDRMTILKRTRLWHVTIKANLLDHLVKLIYDLAITKTAFERDFDKYWANLQAAQARLQLNGYAKWEKQLISSFQGRPARRTNPPVTPSEIR